MEKFANSIASDKANQLGPQKAQLSSVFCVRLFPTLGVTMKFQISLFSIILIFAFACSAFCEEKKLEDYKGVVTFHLLPAKVMKVNKIIENPKPGTSYIGPEGLLVELEENPNVMANWTVVNIKYYKYPTPKIIKYEILSEQKEITVNYHAVKVETEGDLSAYIP